MRRRFFISLLRRFANRENVPYLARVKMGKIFLKIDIFFCLEILKSESFYDIIFKNNFLVYAMRINGRKKKNLARGGYDDGRTYYL